MPKKKAHEEVLETETVEIPVPETKIVKEIKLTTCGHVNKQHFNAEGKLEDLACTLDPRHPGDHQAPYKKNVADHLYDEKNRIVKITYHLEDAVSYWNDSAGKPADKVKSGEVAQMTGFQRDLVMQILSRNPRLNVDQALAQARQSPEWNSGELS